MKIMVSACLLGENCKYNGGNNYSEKLAEFLMGHEVIPVCPELLGGLKAPREPVELRDGRAVDRYGSDLDAEFTAGAERTLEIARKERPDLVVLQSRSPSCGVNMIYDGTFSGKKIIGRGKTAALLVEAGFKVVDIEDLPERKKEKMKIWLIRHGESVYNAKGLFQGHIDSELSERGVAQAEEKAKDFPQDFDVCLCSTLVRAKKTADILLPGMEKTYDPRIMELGLGVWENTAFTEEKTQLMLAGYIPEGGETEEEFVGRIRAFLADVKARYAGKRVVIVTHGGVIQEILKLAGEPARIVGNLELISVEI